MKLIMCLVVALLAHASLAEAQFGRPMRPPRGEPRPDRGQRPGLPPQPSAPPSQQEPVPPPTGMQRPPRPPRTIHSPFQPGDGVAPVSIEVQVTRMQGLGCPPGGAVATLSPDGSSVSILFDKMSTELAAGSPSTQKKTCLIYLGLRFDGPYRVAIVGSDARGFVSVPQGGQSSISVQHFPIFRTDPRLLERMNLTQNFVGPVSQDLVLHSDFHDIPLWSYCGSQMRGRSSMPLMTIGLTIDSSNSNPSENLIASIDSLDIGGVPTLSYNLLWTQDTRGCPP